MTVSRAFTFTREDLLSPLEQSEEEAPDTTFQFRFAQHRRGYFHVPGRILGIDNNVLISDDVWLERKLFIAERNVGIFRRIAKVKGDDGEIVVGGAQENAIPIETFRQLLDRFPNSGELDRYASARVETIIGEFFDGMKSARENYERYLSRRKSVVTDRPLSQGVLLQAEIDKFVFVRETIEAWLGAAESYSERDWQQMIIKIILLIFPKYVAVLENVEIADFYTTPGRTTRRFIDLCLVDAGGNIDAADQGIKAREGFLARLDAVQAETSALQRQIAAREELIASSIRPLSDAEADQKARNMRELLLGADFQKKRRFVRAIIKKIMVHEDRIEIIWCRIDHGRDRLRH